MRASRCRALRDAAYVMPALALLEFLYIYPIGYGFYLSTNGAVTVPGGRTIRKLCSTTPRFTGRW